MHARINTLTLFTQTQNVSLIKFAKVYANIESGRLKKDYWKYRP